MARVIDLNPQAVPVHSGGDPTRRLGWVRCTTKTPGRVVFQLGHTMVCLLTGTVTPPTYMHTALAWQDTEDGRRLVITSDQDIETWKKVYTFVEDRWGTRDSTGVHV